MGLDISVYKPELIKSFDDVNNFDHFTILTYQGEFKSKYKALQPFENCFVELEIEYFDIEHSLLDEGYTREDVTFRSGVHQWIMQGGGVNHISFSGNYDPMMLWKSPKTQGVSITYDLHVKENRRYDLWWDCVKSMKTEKKQLSGKLTSSNHPTYTVMESCIYHPLVSYQRNGMDYTFLENDSRNLRPITDKQVIHAHIEEYALDKEKSRQLLYEPFVEGETFLTYWW